MASKREIAKAHTRSKVIACARDLFASRGFEGVTIRDLAKAVGMSTGAIFANFKDKDELFEAALGRPTPMKRVREWLEMDMKGQAYVHGEEVARLLHRDLFGER